MITKFIEKGVEIAVGAAVASVCGALAYSFLSSNKNDKEEHKLRMTKLKDEYNLKVTADKPANL